MDGGALSGLVNVLEHGATGDGTTDDTAAIQGVLDAYAGKATVFVPDTGHPYIVTPLLLPTGTDLLLHGTLKAPAAAGASTVDIVSASNVTIRGHGTIDGNGAAGTYPNPIASLYIYQSTYVQVSGITIKNALNFNIDALQSSHVRIDKVTLLGGVNSSGFAQGDDCWLTNSTIDGPSGDGGFAFYGAVTNSGAIGNTIKNSGIAGNIPSIGLYVLSDGGSPDPCGNIVMADNVVHNCGGQGIAVLRSTTGAYHDGVIIANNRCYNNGKVAYAPGGSSDLYVDNCHHITFTGNQSSGFGVAGTPTCHGLHVGVNVVGVTLTGNQISNVGQGRTDGIGIYVNSPTDLLASSNNVYDDQATPTTAISIAGTAGGNNQFIGNACQLAITVTLQADTVCANAIGGQWTIGNGTGRGAAIELNGAPGQSSVIEYAVNDKARWFVGNNGTGESTGNAGSDFQIVAVNDAGNATLGTALTIKRSSQQVVFEVAPATAVLPINATNDAAAAAAGVQIGTEYRNGSIKMIRVT
jgi:hypothetical protein